MSRILVVCLLLAAGTAGAQEWEATARACDEEAERTFCVGKAGCPNWQWLVRCTAHNLNQYEQSPQFTALLDSCIQRINDNRTRTHTPAMVGDPVAEAMHCLTARH